MDVTAVCFRDDDWWVVAVPAVPGAWTQGRSLDEAARMAADAVGLMCEVEPDQVRVTVIADPHPYTDERLARWSRWLKTSPDLAS